MARVKSIYVACSKIGFLLRYRIFLCLPLQAQSRSTASSAKSLDAFWLPSKYFKRQAFPENRITVAILAQGAMGKWRPSAGTAPRTPFKRALAACVLAVAAGDAAADYEAAVELRSRDTAESMRLLQRAGERVRRRRPMFLTLSYNGFFLISSF